jgi:hypothetical protein
MKLFSMALFGEAEKGDFHTPYYCKNLPQLAHHLGNPPSDSMGLYYAIQALMYERNVIFFRVKEEGFSVQDYFSGLRILEKEKLISEIAAIAIPGVGSHEIIEAVTPLCIVHKNIMIVSEPDLYDYLMHY